MSTGSSPDRPAAGLNGGRTSGAVARVRVLPSATDDNRPATPVRDSVGEHLQEIVEFVPGGILRWGLVVLGGALALLMGISWLIAYPDVTPGRFTVTTLTPPARLVARVNGEIERILVGDADPVVRGEPLVVFRSSVSRADLNALTGHLDAVEQSLRSGAALPDLDNTLQLGELQAEYAHLLARVADFGALLSSERFQNARAAALEEQVRSYERLHAALLDQQRLLDEDVRLTERERARVQQLAERGLAPPAEVERAEQGHLHRRLAAENGRAAVTRSLVELSSHRGVALDFQQERLEERRRRQTELRNAVLQVRAAIARWEDTYVLTAPMDGTVSLFRDIHESQHLNLFDPVLAVLPRGQGLRARIEIDERGAGKVQRGQRVILRFDSYPDREFGTVGAVVERVSRLGMEREGSEPVYLVEVSLPEGLRTAYGRTLDFRQELRGTAEIVTADRRLVQRFFDQLRPGAGSP